MTDEEIFNIWFDANIRPDLPKEMFSYQVNRIKDIYRDSFDFNLFLFNFRCKICWNVIMNKFLSILK